MKWAVVALAVAVMLAGVLAYQGRKVRADQGYVRDEAGTVWRLVRMQTLGLDQDYVAVYRKQ